MAERTVTTQAKLDAALAAGKTAIITGNGGSYIVRNGLTIVRSNARVVAYGFYAVVVQRSTTAIVSGIHVVKVIGQPTDVRTWLAGNGVDVAADGTCVLYKRVDNDWTTRAPVGSVTRIAYIPGTTVEAPDWEPAPECGNGLHFCPHPWMADAFRKEGRYVACRVHVDDIVVHATPDFPAKVKARRCEVVAEVGRDGAAVTSTEAVA